MSKTHWKQLSNTNYIGSYTLGETPELNVTIKSVSKEIITGPKGEKDEAIVAKLVGQKPFILNVTNCKTIAKIYGTSFIEDWVGKTITLYVAKVNAFGETVDALRIKEVKPKLPELKESDKANWDKVKAALQNGYTVDQIRSKWIISDINAKKLQTK